MTALLIMLALLLASPAAAQPAKDKKLEEPVYEYTGDPIVLPLACPNEDLQKFGMVCPASDPCAAYLELTSVDSIKGKVFLTGNIHGDAVTMYSILLASEDGGLSWREPYRRLRLAGLDRVYFYDKTHGWAAGHIQELDAEPRDPFFLLTTDGGKIWRRRPVFSDERNAMIERFWFDSNRSGGLLIDLLDPNEAGARYARYETMTGAENWMIREVSAKPIHPRRIRERIRDNWRITTSDTTGAWEIQKREAGGWIVISEFQVEVGPCVVEPEPVLAEAPPPSAEPEPRQPRPGQPLEDLPIAPGGVFVIGSPPAANQQPAEIKTDKKDKADKPKIERKPRQ